jgi:O-6-methylguanine DNA methyltransferase
MTITWSSSFFSLIRIRPPVLSGHRLQCHGQSRWTGGSGADDNSVVQVLRRRMLDTPIGRMFGLASETALVALEFSKVERHDRLEARLARWVQRYTVDDGSNAPLDAAAAWLDDYFSGRAADARALPLIMHGTEFERRVWERLREIPAGRTRSYGEIAAELGLRNGARAVGLANGANPLAIIVPCHRVIGANGTLTGYGGGLDRKQWLLDHERRWAPNPTFDF